MNILQNQKTLSDPSKKDRLRNRTKQKVFEIWDLVQNAGKLIEMRYVNKSEIPTPSVLTDETGTGNKEKQSAIEHYENYFTKNIFDPKKIKKFSFKAYKDTSVKQALEKLFKGKCAYCESRYINIHPVDIEHWRPKRKS